MHLQNILDIFVSELLIILKLEKDTIWIQFREVKIADPDPVKCSRTGPIRLYKLPTDV